MIRIGIRGVDLIAMAKQIQGQADKYPNQKLLDNVYELAAAQDANDEEIITNRKEFPEEHFADAPVAKAWAGNHGASDWCEGSYERFAK